MKGTHIYTHFFSLSLQTQAPHPQQITMLPNLFLVVLKLLSLKANDSVAAIKLLNEALLSGYFLASVIVRVIICYWWEIYTIFSKLKLQQGLAISSKEKSFEQQLLSESPPTVTLHNLYSRGHVVPSKYRSGRSGGHLTDVWLVPTNLQKWLSNSCS